LPASVGPTPWQRRPSLPLRRWLGRVRPHPVAAREDAVHRGDARVDVGRRERHRAEVERGAQHPHALARREDPGRRRAAGRLPFHGHLLERRTQALGDGVRRRGVERIHGANPVRFGRGFRGSCGGGRRRRRRAPIGGIRRGRRLAGEDSNRRHGSHGDARAARVEDGGHPARGYARAAGAVAQGTSTTSNTRLTICSLVTSSASAS
jgi:hypothetical protein